MDSKHVDLFKTGSPADLRIYLQPEECLPPPFEEGKNCAKKIHDFYEAGWASVLKLS